MNETDPTSVAATISLATTKALIARGTLTKDEVISHLPPVTGETLRWEQDAVTKDARALVESWTNLDG